MSTITEERIKAEVEGEIRRIEVWNQNASSCEFENCEIHTEPLSVEHIRSLAEQLVRNRLQVELSVEELRAKAHALDQEALHYSANCKMRGGCYLCQAERLEASHA